MKKTDVIDQQTQTFVEDKAPPTMYVSGAYLPSVAGPSKPSTAKKQSGARVFQIAGAGDLRDLEAKAFDAAQALREWYAHSKQMRELSRGPDVEFVKACMKRVVDDADAGMDGITAWVLLDGDRPSGRTVDEYRGTVRDVLLWLAERGLCPAETGREDMKAFKAFLQAEGAPTQMELMRARWAGREAHITYVNDWRGPAALAARLGYGVALRDFDMTEKAKTNTHRNKALTALADRARTQAQGWMASLCVLMSTYAAAPRRERFERYTADTVSLRVTLTRNFWKMALSRQAVFENPLIDLKAAKGSTGRAQKIISRFFSDREVMMVLATCDENREHSPRDKAVAARDAAIIRLMRNQGLRISEVAGLDVSDLNPAAGECGTLTLRHAKGDKTRTILLTEKTRACLDRWLMYRALKRPTTTAIFVSLHEGGNYANGDRLSVRSVREMFDLKQKQVGIKQPGRSAHGLRHSYATRAMMEDPSQLRALSHSMGHSGITVTEGYVDAAQLIDENPAKLADL